MTNQETITWTASRLSTGNRFFPGEITLTGTEVIFRKRSLFGFRETAVHYQRVLGVEVIAGMVFGEVLILGSSGIRASGFRRSEAIEIKRAVEDRTAWFLGALPSQPSLPSQQPALASHFEGEEVEELDGPEGHIVQHHWS